MLAIPMIGGVGLPTLLLVAQLLVGLYAAFELGRSLARRRVGFFTAGQLIIALLLTTLGADGLFLGQDVVGQIVYRLDLDPGLARPALIASIVIGIGLWMLDPEAR